jgi:3-oxoacyl-[acyl-carrier protein] reductase
MSLKGRVALVTGGNRGIGKAIALELADRGAAVAVQYFSDVARADEVIEAIKERGGIGLAVQADVRKRDDVDAMIDFCQGNLGAIDILINGARQIGAKKPFLELQWSDYEPQIETIVQGAFNCCQAVLPAMMEKKHGRVINLLSAVLVEPDWRWHTYAAAKGALFYFSRNLAAEMGPHGITVNMVSPGFVPTDRTSPHNADYRENYLKLTPVGRLGRPEEIAKAVAFLAGDDAAFITGANVPVVGGKVMF